MAYHYLMKYVGTYRVLPELDLQTHDVPRNRKGEVADGYDDLYIPCRCGAKIYYYGQAENKTVILSAYFPKKTTIYSGIKNKITTSCGFDFREGDKDATLSFYAQDMDEIAQILGAKVRGADISPFSVKNLPLNKDVVIPAELLQQYKEAIDGVPMDQCLAISRITNEFISKKFAKSQLKRDKNFDYKKDMKKLCLFRQPKEYIYFKGEWDNYIKYLKREIKKL